MKQTPRWERITIIASLSVAAVALVAGLAMAGNYGDGGSVNGNGRVGGGDYGHTYDGCGNECGNQTVFGRASDSGLRGSARTGGGWGGYTVGDGGWGWD